MIVPHPANKLEIEALTTPLSHIRPRSIAIEKEPLHDAPHAHQTRQVHEHDRVGPLQSQLECAGVVAVHYPRIPIHQISNGFDPLIGLRLHPARTPEKLVEMVYFEIQQFTKLSSNG